VTGFARPGRAVRARRWQHAGTHWQASTRKRRLKCPPSVFKSQAHASGAGAGQLLARRWPWRAVQGGPGVLEAISALLVHWHRGTVDCHSALALPAAAGSLAGTQLQARRNVFRVQPESRNLERLGHINHCFRVLLG